MEPTKAASLIERRRKELRISGRDAARAAGLSEGRWRQIAKGYQQVTSDVRAPVVAPPATLARMAHAVGVSADELEQSGDAPAARALREMASAASPGPLAAVTDDELLSELRRRLARPREELVGHVSAPIVTTEPVPGRPAERSSGLGEGERATWGKGQVPRPRRRAPSRDGAPRSEGTNHEGR